MSHDTEDDFHAQLVADMRQTFIEDCDDKLENLDTYLENMANQIGTPADNLLSIMRIIHSIKGLGGTFGFPAISIIAHRLEDFLKNQTDLNHKDIKNIYLFLDQIRALMERKEQPGSDEIAKITRALPIRTTEQPGKIIPQKQKSVEVLSIMPKSLQQRLINDELRDCGFRVSSLHSSFDSIEIAVHTRPDLIVLSAVIDDLDGLELTNIFRSLKATQDTPIILLTSFTENELPENVLPPKVALARKSDYFANDLSNCLLELNIV